MAFSQRALACVWGIIIRAFPDKQVGLIISFGILILCEFPILTHFIIVLSCNYPLHIKAKKQNHCPLRTRRT